MFSFKWEKNLFNYLKVEERLLGKGKAVLGVEEEEQKEVGYDQSTMGACNSF